MEYYSGQELGPRPHLAVLFHDSIGNFAVVTPLLRGLHEKYPGCILDYYGGPRSQELEEASPFIDSRVSLFGGEDGLRGVVDYVRRREEESGPYDLAINLEFHPLNALVMAVLNPRYAVGNAYEPDLRKELPLASTRQSALATATWTHPSFLDEFGDVVCSNFIGEIFCRLVGVETDYQRTEIPWAPPGSASGELPDLLIATGASRPAKLWPVEYWEALLYWCEGRGLSVGLLGDKPAEQVRYYHSASAEDFLLSRTALQDLRGRFTLPQVAGALREARACVAIDNGIMHLAIGVGTPTVAIFGASSWRLWAPQMPHLQLLLPDTPCPLCEQNNYRNPDCLRPGQDQVCMRSILPATVTRRLERLLG